MELALVWLGSAFGSWLVIVGALPSELLRHTLGFEGDADREDPGKSPQVGMRNLLSSRRTPQTQCPKNGNRARFCHAQPNALGHPLVLT